MTTIGPGLFSNYRLPAGYDTFTGAGGRTRFAGPDETGAEEAVRQAGPSATGAMLQSLQSNSAFIAQQLSQQEYRAEENGGDSGDSGAVAAFLEYMAKSPEERYFESFLRSRGMTPEDLAALPPEQHKALLKEFQEYVKQKVENEAAEKVARTSRAELL
jgi:hypothetical protein